MIAVLTMINQKHQWDETITLVTVIEVTEGDAYSNNKGGCH